MADAFGIDIAASASKADVARGVLMLVSKWTREHPDFDPQKDIETRPDGSLSVTFRMPGYRIPVMEPAR